MIIYRQQAGRRYPQVTAFSSLSYSRAEDSIGVAPTVSTTLMSLLSATNRLVFGMVWGRVN
jgi:hypothetical protein